jgi:hypothetical protein
VRCGRVGLIILAILVIGATSRPSRDEPTSYVAHRVASPPTIDGALDDPAWSSAAWTEDFIDIEGTRKPAPPMRTRAKVAWDAMNLYVAAEMSEPRVWATMKHRDEPLYQEQAFELFLDPDGDGKHYLELEINPLNTVFDLVMSKPYRDKGRADESIDVEGLRTAVRVNGTIGQAGDVDEGWTVEIAIPWAALKPLHRDATPPREGERWRVNFARMRRDAPNVKDAPPRGLWVWSSQGAVNMHAPERWGTIEFAARMPSTRPSP